MATPRVAIDSLPVAATPLAPADQLIVQQSGVTKRVAAPELVAAMAARIDALETRIEALEP